MTFRFIGMGVFGAVFLCMTAVAAQDFLPNQAIVRLKDDSRADAVIPNLKALGVEKLEPLVPALNLHLASLRAGADVRSLVNRLNRANAIAYAQPNHRVTRRSVPNDPKFSNQWNFRNGNGADIRATDAWNRGTGGRDRLGHDIVVAVVDGGMDLTHRDLVANLWVNPGEIPGNGVDDDSNGFIDDLNGWNAYDSNGKIPLDNHATHVAGIVGAEGDNQQDVVGVNWKVKIMAVAGASGDEAVVARAYGYVMKQKSLWIESKGQRGANIVATNSSFGVDYADCGSAEFKVWNDLYNAMGELGILSAAATANLDINVDTAGDVPTGCASDYIISVTNTTSNDHKYNRAAYGKTHVDLGAPGTAIESTIIGHKVGSMTGTSMATPHVAGAVGLLHSLASQSFQERYREDAGAAALELKSALLTTVDPLADLKDRTVSGGRLNLFKAAQLVVETTPR